MKKIISLSLFAFTLAGCASTNVAQGHRAPSSAAKSLSCSLHSRQIDAPESVKVVSASLHKESDSAKAVIERYYEVEVVTVSSGQQGQLLVKYLPKNEYIYKNIWQSLSQFEGMDIPGGLGFTGLIYLGGGTNSPYGIPGDLKNGQLPELQISCSLR
jgi:hypothetical protein